MTITQDGFNFEGATHHGDLVSPQAETPVVQGQFFGVRGEAHLVGEPYGQDIECDLTLTGYSTATLLKAAIARIERKKGQLTGAVVLTGNLAHTYPPMTFLDVRKPTPAQYDGSGVNGWTQTIYLKWRQRT